MSPLELMRAEGRRYRLEEQPHYIYRCFDAAGRLLYVGCTSDMKKRMKVHRYNTKSDLWRLMARHEVSEPYAGWIAAHDAEVAAIRDECPLLNVRHAGARKAA